MWINGINCLVEWGEENKTLFKENSSERQLCGSLAQKLKEYLNDDFRGFYYDVEVNRGFAGGKKIVSMKTGNKDIVMENIFCDLVVHNRGEKNTSKENLIAIEMKKSSYASKSLKGEYEEELKNNRIADKARLCALTVNPENSRGYYKVFSFPKPDEGINEEFKSIVNGYQLGAYIELNDTKEEIDSFEVNFFIDGKCIENLAIEIDIKNKRFNQLKGNRKKIVRDDMKFLFGR